jgi:two-component system OmpR family sensor kinase
MSLSNRIALGVALVLSLTLIVLGVTMVRATRATLTAEIDDRLQSSVERAQRVIPPHWDTIIPAARDVIKTGPPDDQSLAQGTGFSKPANATDSNEKEVHITGPGGNEQDQQEHDADFFHDVTPRNMALILIGPQGNKLEFLSGYTDAPNSPPDLSQIPGPDPSAPKQLINLPSVDHSLMYRVLLWPGPGGITFAAAETLQPVDDAVKNLVRTLVIAGLLALAVASLISWWVIRHGLRPVDRMVETAAAIADGDLSRRVPDADPETELGRLGTALNEMLGQIEAGIKEREAAEAKLRRFLADAAHELRTPLTSLRGYAELYRQGALPTTEAVGNAMGRIESEGARMARLVDDLLLLARTDQGRALEKEPVDLTRLAREAAGDFAAADPSRPLLRDLDGAAVVIGDPIRLRQAIDNLLTNVRVHTPPQTPARVSVRRNGSWVEVTVADDGPGIPTEDQPRLFERFWRGDPSRGRTAAGGAGLGLSIVDSLVRAHGGTVAVKSAPGHGAAFTLRLPLAGRRTEDGGRKPEATNGDSHAASREPRVVSKAAP